VLPVIHCQQFCRQREDDGDPICTQANPRGFLTPEIGELMPWSKE
jgi:hypothetical protein